ncbi:MAG: helix-turn-helix domain-containing protein [Candidatus Diapherotrites archaeon]
MSYSNSIKEKYLQALNSKQDKINSIEKEIFSLSEKLLITNKSKCSQDSKNYNLCIYLSSIEIKNENKSKEEIRSRIGELKLKKDSLEKESLDLTDFYFSIGVAILSSLFLSISILEISNRLKDKEDKAIIELLEKGYSVEQIGKKLNLSRATIYRRLKNERN